MEITKVNGKCIIKFGDYIRFGNATKFYRFLEYPPPVHDTSRDQDSTPILPKPLQGVDANNLVAINSVNNNSSLPLSGQMTQTQTGQQNQHPTKLPSNNNIINNSLSRSLPDRRNQQRDNFNSYNESRNEQKNMTISINYPASDLNHPLAIHIDPTSGGSGYKKNNILNPYSAPHIDRNPTFDKFDYIGNNVANNFVVDDDNSNVDEEINNIMKYNNNLLVNGNNLYKSDEIRRISPDIANIDNSNMTEIDSISNKYNSNHNGQVRKLRYDRYNSDGLNDMEDSNNYPTFAPKTNDISSRLGDNKSKTRISSDSNSFAILLRSKESNIGNSSAVQFQSTKPRIEPITAEKIELLSLPTTAKIDFVINEILGHNTNLDDYTSKDSNRINSLDILYKSKVPAHVQAEIIAEDLQGGDVTIINDLNCVLYELNSLLKQSYAGMYLDEGNKEFEVSNDFDQMMQGFSNNLLKGVVDQIQSLSEHPIILALISTDDDDYKSNIGNILNILSIRISRLYSFLSGNYLESDFNSLKQKELYEVQTFVLLKVIEDIDYMNKLIWNVIQAVDNAVSDTTGIIIPKSNKFINVDPKVTTTSASTENNKAENKNILSNELEELRKLKEIDKKAKEADTKNKKLIKMTSNFTKFFIFCRFIKWKIQTLNANKIKLKRKLLSRMIRDFNVPVMKIVSRAFNKWNKTIIVENNTKFSIKDEELCKVKNELYSCTHKLAELESNNDLIIALNAERALNRELSNLNRELRICVHELDTKLLECTQGPVAQRKCLVRDVLLSREEELAIARREAKFLREEFNRLQQSVSNVTPTSDKTKSPERGNSPVSKKYIDKQNINKESDKISKKGIIPPQLYHSSEMSKSIAKQVVMYEVRRLMVGYQQLQLEKNNLSNKLIVESNQNSHLTTALQALEVRLHNRERSQHALLILLKQRLGEKGINELINALEEMGAGSHVLLKDAIPYKNYASSIQNNYVLEEENNPPYENVVPRELDKTYSKILESKEEYKNAIETGIFG